MTVLGVGGGEGDGKRQRRASDLVFFLFFFLKKHTCMSPSFVIIMQQENTRHSKGCDSERHLGDKPQIWQIFTTFSLLCTHKNKNFPFNSDIGSCVAWEGPGNNQAYEVCLGTDQAYAFRSVHGAGHVLCSQKGK